ncbi:uncharacterized protein F5147DRAFT_649568 [Suillus discolor]|uniref:Uncharacterized protein n=1 Tax=Suillus discolor TaxID=1912936 RepID=A0A9P7FDI4_9AGAM|nr:uncharacterized protein F5147DRAFT_649568 [Suillus discolor]KAG2115162.1 hypothetical protein F5147DRAFT_649568 [Suillus discolor]
MGQKKVDKEVISLVSSDTLSGSEDNLEESVVLNSNYQDDISSKKRKAKSEGTLRASKKRSPSVVPAEKAVLAKKMKGKVPVRPKAKVPERRALSRTAESSSDEHIQDVMVQAQPAKHLHDGLSAQGHSVTAVDFIVDNDATAPSGSAITSNTDATNSVPTRPLPPSPTLHHAGSLVPASKLPVVRPPSLQREECLVPAAQAPVVQPPSIQHGASLGPAANLQQFKTNPLESEMVAAPNDRDFDVKSHPMTRAHDADMRPDGYDSYVETYWHPPSSAYFGPGGRYQHGYGCEYHNEYPKDQEDGE